MPLDFESRHACRLLQQAAGRDRAVVLLLYLFRALAYAAECHPVGKLPEANARLLVEDLQFLKLDRNEITLLREAQLLTEGKPEEGGGYFCALFAQTNGHLTEGGGVSIQKMGGFARVSKLQREKAEEAAPQMAMLLEPEVFVRPDTQEKMSSEEVKRTLMVVLTMDMCVGKKMRNKSECSRGLIEDAYRVGAAFDNEAIQRVSTWLRSQREKLGAHPALPQTAEEILREFERWHGESLKK